MHASSAPAPSTAASSNAIWPAPAHSAQFDETQPEYWVAKLGEKQERATAILALFRLSEELFVRANKDRAHPDVIAFVDKVLPPLSRAYLDNHTSLDESVREVAILTLAGFRDPRVAPVFEMVFEEYARTGRYAKEFKWACYGVSNLRLRSVSASLFRAFERVRPSTTDGSDHRELREAVLAVADPAWAPRLLTIVEEDVPVLDMPDVAPPEEQAAFADQLYRSNTAARLLGELREAKAARPLIRVVLDPSRGKVAEEAELALVKIGKPAAVVAAALLNGSDPELTEYQKERTRRFEFAFKYPDLAPPPAIGVAELLGAIGRREGTPPILAALRSARSDHEKARLLNILARLPHNHEVVTTFKDGFARLSIKAEYEFQNANVALAKSATSFFDSAFTELLVKKARGLKHDKYAMNSLALAAIQTMNASQLGMVKTLVDELPRETGTSVVIDRFEDLPGQFEAAAALVRQCRDDPACYLAAASDSKNQTERAGIVALKALHRVGQLGQGDTTERLLELLPSLEGERLRFTAAQLIEHRLPYGSLAVADELQVITDSVLASGNWDKVAYDEPLREVMIRLRGRAHDP